MLEELIQAINSGNNPKALELIGKMSVVELNTKGSYMEMPLHVAAAKNNAVVIKPLLDKEIDINGLGLISHYTPLHIAIIKNNLDAAKLFIKEGADCNQLDASGSTPLFYTENKETAQILIDAKAQVTISVNGFTALHAAAGKGSVDIMHLLLDNGAREQINQADTSGYTPLFYAKNKAAAQTLINEGAQVNIVAKDGRTVLHCTPYGHKTEVLKVLLDNGAHKLVNHADNNGWTPLWVASQCQSISILKLLIEYGADVNYQNPKQDYQTSLIYTANTIASHMVGSDYLNVKWLITLGADLAIKDAFGRSVHDYAAENGRLKHGKLWSRAAEIANKAIAGEVITEVDPCLNEPEMQELFLARIEFHLKKHGIKDGISLEKYKEVLPESLIKRVHIKEILSKVSEGNDRISSNEEQAILLLGNTGSGKSTLAHALVGKKLKAVFDDETGRLLVEAVQPLDEIKISHNKTSETKVPNKCSTNGKIVVWDCPGFNDTDLTQEIANSFFIKKLYNQHPKMKFVLVASESDLTSNRGMTFTNLVKQFCSGFTDVSLVKDSVTLVVSQAGSNKQIKHLQNEINKIIQQSGSLLSKEVTDMLGYLSSNLQLFHQPKEEGELPASNLLEAIDQAGKYAESKDGMGKFSLSSKAQDYCLELLKMSANGLEQMVGTLLTASLTPVANSQAGDGNVFAKAHDLVKDWLPAKISYKHALQVKSHAASEHFIGVKQLIKLAEIAKVVDMLGNNNNEDGKLDQVTAIAEKLFNIFEEYVVIGGKEELNAAELGLKEQIQHFAYMTQQMKGYCKLFAGLISKESAEKFSLSNLANGLIGNICKFSKQLSELAQKAIINLPIVEDSANVKYFKDAIDILNLQKDHPSVIKKKALCFKAIGDVKEQKGESALALKYYYESLALDKTLVGAHEKIAAIHYSICNLKEAIGFYKVLGDVEMLSICYKNLMLTDKSYQLKEEYADTLVGLSLYEKARKYYKAAEVAAKDPKIKNDLVKKMSACLKSEVKAEQAAVFDKQAETGELYDFNQLDLDPYIQGISEQQLLGSLESDLS